MTALWVVDTYSAMGHAMTADKGITDAEYRLISAIKRHDWRDGICRVSQADLGDHCAKDVRTVRRLVHTLKQKHLLEEINDPERPGRARVYRLLGSATTSPQTGQSWPVYDHAQAAQSGQGWPNKSARSGRLNRPTLAGLKKTPENPAQTGIPESGYPEAGLAAGAAPPPADPPAIEARTTTEPPRIVGPAASSRTTEPPRASHDPSVSQPASSPPKSPARPSGKPLLPVPKPQPEAERADSPQGRLIDLLRDGGVPSSVKPSERDFAAIKNKCQDIDLVAACYLDVFHGRYGDAFMQSRLSVQTVCYQFLDGYLAWKAQGSPERPSAGGQGGQKNHRQPQRPAYSAGAGAPNHPQVVESAKQRAKGW